MKVVGNNSRFLELTALGKAGETYIAFARNGKLLEKRLIVEPIEVKTVYPPRAVVAVAFRGEVYVGFSPEPKNRAVTVIRYEIFRKPDKQGRPESAMLGRVSAPQGEQVGVSLPEAFKRLPENSRIAKRAFWYRDATIKGNKTYVYAVRAVAVDADPPLSPLVSTEPVPTPYETDMRLTGGGGGRGVFEILKWTRQGWKMRRFSVIVGNEIGQPKKDKTGITVDFRTGYKLLSLDMSARKAAASRYVKGKAICEDENGNKLELWRGSFVHGAASETIRQQLGKAKRLRPKPPPGKNGDTEPEPEELKPD